MGVLNYNVSDGSPPYNIQLYGPSGLVFNLTNRNGSGNYTPNLNGTYYLVIEDQAGCFADTVFYQVDFISTLENYIFNDLKIYPNPTNDYLNIEFNNYSSQNISITFENILGQEIIRYNIKEGSQEFSQQFNISEFSKGVYYVKLISNNLKLLRL